MVQDDTRPPTGNALIETEHQLTHYEPQDMWHGLPTIRISNAHLARNRVVSARRKDPAYVAIDMLRTRLLQVLKDKGWKRVGITSPTAGCGKTFVASNLAISLARGESRRVVLMDMDLRTPGLAQIFGVTDPPVARDYLSGVMLPEEYFLRVGQNLALGLNGAPEPSAAELILENMTGEILDEMQELLQPDIILYDLPPALSHDDVIAFLPQVDGVLLVVGGGVTKAEEVRAVEQLLDDKTPLIGAILNKAEGAQSG